MESITNFGESSVVPPVLLVELPPWRQVFFRNLADLLWPRQLPPLRLASKPAEFWPDVFVRRPIPWSKFSQSGGLHIAMLLMLWGASLIWARRPQIIARPKFNPENVIYYEASEYLPPLDTGGMHAQLPQKGDPVYAPQPIISVPPEADNPRQTIVTPPNLKLDRDVPLPNVVSWPKTAVSVPIAATERKTINIPDLYATVAAPPPDVKLAASRQTIEMHSDIVAPPPEVDTSIRRIGDLNIGSAAVVAPAPQLSLEAQRMTPRAQGELANAAASAVPPSPSVEGLARGSSSDRLIALGIHPAVAAGPVVAPEGNRRGSFSASPQGKIGATGTPDVPGDPKAADPDGGKGQGDGNGAGSGKRGDMPPGLLVGSGTDPNHTSAIGGNGRGEGIGGIGNAGDKEPAVLAKATPPRVSSTPQREAAAVSSNNQATEEEKKIFGDRKFYSLALNVPNLNSGGGSWIIHFAEMNPNEDTSSLTAPSAYAMSDPAYPLELMKQHIQGTVTLYAVIRSDGTVSDIRVLRSADDRLDQYAREALARWRFHPATKDGNAVALEAVFKVPFRPGRMRSSF